MTNQIKRCIRVLSAKDRKKLFYITLVQTILGFFDLLGILLIGALAAVSISSIYPQSFEGPLNTFLNFLRISDFSLSTQAGLLAGGALFILVGRTVSSIYFTRRVLTYLSQRSAEISGNLVAKLLSQDLLVIESHSRQATLYFLTTGVNVITLQIVAPLVVLVTDLMLLTVISIGLICLDPLTAIGTLALFSTLIFLMFKFMDNRASHLGLVFSNLNIQSNDRIIEALASYRESVVRSRRGFYANTIKQLRSQLASTVAELNFMPYVSKYVIETSVIVGAVLLGAMQFFLNDITHAFSTLAVFLSAGSRVAPAVLRIQQGSINVRTSIGQASPTLDFIETLGDLSLDTFETNEQLDFKHTGFRADIKLENVNFSYPNSIDKALSEISLDIPNGTLVAIVGPSGAGKTTLIDTLLGVLSPNSGKVSISGFLPLKAAAHWPGAMSYIPQEVEIIAGSVRENISLGFSSHINMTEQIEKAVRIADLQTFIAGSVEGLDLEVGEKGFNLSGGQRQRLGIARAMFTEPKLLVLDEATSSLDAQSESTISAALSKLKGKTTIVMIAHRLSSVRNADIVVYMCGGKILAQGSFEEVRNKIPDFDAQANLMGL